MAMSRKLLQNLQIVKQPLGWMLHNYNFFLHSSFLNCIVISSLTCRGGPLTHSQIYTTWQRAACSLCLTKITICIGVFWDTCRISHCHLILTTNTLTHTCTNRGQYTSAQRSFILHKNTVLTYVYVCVCVCTCMWVIVTPVTFMNTP